MVLVHTFQLYDPLSVIEESEHKAILEDYLFSYILDSLMWLPASDEKDFATEQLGLTGNGTTYFDKKGITKLSNMLDGWLELFCESCEGAKLTIGYDIQKDSFVMEPLNKSKVLSQLQQLKNLCEKALAEKQCMTYVCFEDGQKDVS